MRTKSGSVVDPDPTPGSGIRCLSEPWIRDPGWVKKFKIRIRDEHPESFETIFWVKIFKFFDADADPRIWKSFRPWLRDPGWKKFGSGSRIRNTRIRTAKMLHTDPDFPSLLRLPTGYMYTTSMKIRTHTRSITLLLKLRSQNLCTRYYAKS